MRVDAIRFLLESCFVFPTRLTKNVIRKFNYKVHSHRNDLFSFNGETFKAEPSSKFPHYRVNALGSYKNSPFVTGGLSSTNGLKTEIFDLMAKKWKQLADYPFTGYDR